MTIQMTVQVTSRKTDFGIRLQDSFMENSWSIYGYLCSHKKKNREILAIFSPNPREIRKERNHERLGKCKALARNRKR